MSPIAQLARIAVSISHRSDAHYVAPPSLYPVNNSHLVTIHKGCDYKCTYCIVPATRGPQSEKAPDVILDEIRGIVAGGGREVTLHPRRVLGISELQSARPVLRGGRERGGIAQSGGSAVTSVEADAGRARFDLGVAAFVLVQRRPVQPRERAGRRFVAARHCCCCAGAASR